MDTFVFKKALPYIICIIAGILMISYKNMATSKGWNVGQLYAGDLPIIIGGGLVIICWIGLFWITKWYYVILIIIVSWLISGVLMSLSKSFAQSLAILLIIFAATLRIFLQLS